MTDLLIEIELQAGEKGDGELMIDEHCGGKEK